LRFDANGDLERKEFLSLMAWSRDNGIFAVEEPLAWKCYSDIMKNIHDRSFPVIWDESLVACSDANELLASGISQMWNIRLGKNGGITGAIEMIRKADGANIRYIFGALVGQSLIEEHATKLLAKIFSPVLVETSYPRFFIRPNIFNSMPDWHGNSLTQLSS